MLNVPQSTQDTKMYKRNIITVQKKIRYVVSENQTMAARVL